MRLRLRELLGMGGLGGRRVGGLGGWMEVSIAVAVAVVVVVVVVL